MSNPQTWYNKNNASYSEKRKRLHALLEIRYRKWIYEIIFFIQNYNVSSTNTMIYFNFKLSCTKSLHLHHFKHKKPTASGGLQQAFYLIIAHEVSRYWFKVSWFCIQNFNIWSTVKKSLQPGSVMRVLYYMHAKLTIFTSSEHSSHASLMLLTKS